jgi:putative isomerase
MLKHATIPIERAWNTWSSRPAEMVFLPLGVRLTPVVFAASTGQANLFPAGDAGVRLGRHAIDGSVVELELTHAGTRLALAWRKVEPFAVLGSWRGERLGEWGLRFWVNVCVSAEGGEIVRYDAARGALVVQSGSRFVALVADCEPVQVTGHASVEALAADYEAHGYFWLGARAAEAPVLAMRFNLEMAREARFAAAVADRQDLAVAHARRQFEAAPEPRLPEQRGRFAGALDAVRDVTAWNTVFDEANARPYTSISRNWSLKKFGGFGVWLNDQQYAAHLAGLFDAELARENLCAALANVTPQGNLACLVTANDAWVDRSQLPIGAFLLWLMYLRTGSRPLLDRAYAALSRNHAWWWRNRDPHGRGLVSFGTSDVGDGLYKGTHFGARNESSMDNSPIHDEAEYDRATRTLTTIDVGLNSLLALDAEFLGRIAVELGLREAAEAHFATAKALRRRIGAELWDEARGVFANRLRSGGFVKSVGPTSFYPLLCGAASDEQAARLMQHYDDPEKFAGGWLLPGAARDDPAAGDNVYWRGRIWPPLNFLVWHGLKRAGFEERATRLAAAGYELFAKSWREGLCPENYNAETGEALDQPDTEKFYNWGALLPALAVAEVMDVNPWNGWEIANAGEDVSVGPTQTPAGLATLTIVGGRLTLVVGERPLLATALRGRLTHLRFDARMIAFTLPQRVPDQTRVELPGVPARGVVLARAGRLQLSCEIAEGGGVALTLDSCHAGLDAQVVWAPVGDGEAVKVVGEME